MNIQNSQFSEAVLCFHEGLPGIIQLFFFCSLVNKNNSGCCKQDLRQRDYNWDHGFLFENEALCVSVNITRKSALKSIS
jgi:hypothetical protein